MTMEKYYTIHRLRVNILNVILSACSRYSVFVWYIIFTISTYAYLMFLET